MFRALVILVAVTAGVLADEDPCLRFLEHGILHKCCKMDFPTLSDETKAIFKECRSLPAGPNSCEREMCMANKKGYATPDGKIDMAKLKEKITAEGKDGELGSLIVKNCVDGDISKFGPADMCDATKVRRCMEMQLIKTCSEWANDGVCVGLSDIAADCKKKHD